MITSITLIMIEKYLRKYFKLDEDFDYIGDISFLTYSFDINSDENIRGKLFISDSQDTKIIIRKTEEEGETIYLEKKIIHDFHDLVMILQKYKKKEILLF